MILWVKLDLRTGRRTFVLPMALVWPDGRLPSTRRLPKEYPHHTLARPHEHFCTPTITLRSYLVALVIGGCGCGGALGKPQQRSPSSNYFGLSRERSIKATQSWVHAPQPTRSYSHLSSCLQLNPLSSPPARPAAASLPFALRSMTSSKTPSSSRCSSKHSVCLLYYTSMVMLALTD